MTEPKDNGKDQPAEEKLDPSVDSRRSEDTAGTGKDAAAVAAHPSKGAHAHLVEKSEPSNTESPSGGVEIGSYDVLLIDPSSINNAATESKSEGDNNVMSNNAAQEQDQQEAEMHDGSLRLYPDPAHLGNNRFEVLVHMHQPEFVAALAAGMNTMPVVHKVIQVVTTQCRPPARFFVYRRESWQKLTEEETLQFVRQELANQETLANDPASFVDAALLSASDAAAQDDTKKRGRRASLLRRSVSETDVPLQQLPVTDKKKLQDRRSSERRPSFWNSLRLPRKSLLFRSESPASASNASASAPQQQQRQGAVEQAKSLDVIFNNARNGLVTQPPQPGNNRLLVLMEVQKTRYRIGTDMQRAAFLDEMVSTVHDHWSGRFLAQAMSVENNGNDTPMSYDILQGSSIVLALQNVLTSLVGDADQQQSSFTSGMDLSESSSHYPGQHMPSPSMSGVLNASVVPREVPHRPSVTSSMARSRASVTSSMAPGQFSGPVQTPLQPQVSNASLPASYGNTDTVDPAVEPPMDIARARSAAIESLKSKSRRKGLVSRIRQLATRRTSEANPAGAGQSRFLYRSCSEPIRSSTVVAQQQHQPIYQPYTGNDNVHGEAFDLEPTPIDAFGRLGARPSTLPTIPASDDFYPSQDLSISSVGVPMQNIRRPSYMSVQSSIADEDGYGVSGNFSESQDISGNFRQASYQGPPSTVYGSAGGMLYNGTHAHNPSTTPSQNTQMNQNFAVGDPGYAPDIRTGMSGGPDVRRTSFMSVSSDSSRSQVPKGLLAGLPLRFNGKFGRKSVRNATTADPRRPSYMSTGSNVSIDANATYIQQQQETLRRTSYMSVNSAASARDPPVIQREVNFLGAHTNVRAGTGYFNGGHYGSQYPTPAGPSSVRRSSQSSMPNLPLGRLDEETSTAHQDFSRRKSQPNMPVTAEQRRAILQASLAAASTGAPDRHEALVLANSFESSGSGGSSGGDLVRGSGEPLDASDPARLSGLSNSMVDKLLNSLDVVEEQSEEFRASQEFRL